LRKVRIPKIALTTIVKTIISLKIAKTDATVTNTIPNTVNALKYAIAMETIIAVTTRLMPLKRKRNISRLLQKKISIRTNATARTANAKNRPRSSGATYFSNILFPL
jgi:hypothetical protein